MTLDRRSARRTLWVVLLAVGLGLGLWGRRETAAEPVRVPVEIIEDILAPAGDADKAPADPAAEKAETPDAGTPQPDAAAVTTPLEVKSQSPKVFPLVPEGKRLVYHAQLSDVVDLGIGPFLERVMTDAEDAGANAIIVEIDTPGGRVDAAVEIKDLLLRSRVPTIAFINKQAISAGALIAFAHDYIVWSHGATMGAATPIQMGGGGEAQPVEEKMVSYMRGVMRATAEAKGRDGLVAEAMVDDSIELPGYAPKGKLLTAAESQAEELGLLDGRADSIEEVLTLAGLEGAEVVRPSINWAEKTARFLTHPVVSSILMTIGMLGILIEFYTPGIGFAGIIGAIALFLFFAGHLAVNLAGLEELLLFVVGAALVVVEIFFIPGFGIAGIAGALFIAISLVLALVGLDLRIAWDLGVLGDAVLQFAVALVVAAVAFVVAMRFLPAVGPVRRLILTDAIRPDEGYEADRASLPGNEGVAITDLRPGGKVRIGDRKLDVSAYNEYVRKGERVRVVNVDGPRITVERIPETEGGSDVV
jgi:membrane-bound serine protease (ClpP class)